MFSYQPLTPTDIIEIIGILATLITSIVAIAISVKTLKQNSKMIEESTRPYISMYLGTTYFSNTTMYLIMKNYGTSSAVITNFSCSYDLSHLAIDKEYVPFSHIVGSTLCPGESLLFPIDATCITEDMNSLNIQITYKTVQNTYIENSVINFAAHFDIAHLRANSKDNHLQEISFALQDIAEKML